MVPLKVGAGLTKKQKSTVVVVSTKHGLCDGNMVGRDEEGSY